MPDRKVSGQYLGHLDLPAGEFERVPCPHRDDLVGGSAFLTDRQPRGRIGRIVLHHHDADTQPGNRGEAAPADNEFLHGPASASRYHATELKYWSNCA